MTNQLNPTVYSLTADVPTGMTIAEDSRFKSVALLNAGQSTLGQLTATSQSFSVWLKRQSVTADITFAITHGWAIKDDGVVWLDGVETDTVIPAEQWFHLTLVCTEKRLTLYVNGDYASHKDGTFAAASGDLAFSSVSGGVCLYQQIVFDCVLEDSAVQSNFFGSQPTVKQSFTHVQPIDVKIENSTTSKFSSYPDNKIFIVKVEDASADSGDEASNEKKAEIEQNLHIKNIGQEALEFLVLAESDLSPSIDHYHFEFRFRNGVFTGIKDYLSISSEEGWEFSEPTQNTDDNSWSIYGLAKSKKTLEKGGSFNFAFMYRTADAGRGERGTLLNVNYQNITSSSGNNVQGDKNVQIDVLNLAGINLTTPFTPEVYAASDIQFEDEETSGQETPRKVTGIFGLSSQVAVNSTTNVILELKNQSKKNIQFDTSRDNHGIEIHIPVGQLSSDLVEGVDKLTTPIAPYVGEKIVGAFDKLSNSDDLAIFRWQPSKPSQSDDVYSASIEPNDILRLGISEVITSSKQGLVNIKIVLRGVRDLATLAYSVNLMKVTRDIATFVGNDKVGIGVPVPRQKLEVNGSISADKFVDKKNGSFYVQPSHISVFTQVRAQVFYDTENTSYYLQPHSTSVLNNVKANKFIDKEDNSYYVEPSKTSMFTQVRAQIFYDKNNTNYYMQPHSTSKFNKLDIASLRFTDSTATKASHRDMPIVFKRYSNLGNNVSKKTDFKTSEYNAAIVGMRALNGGISANGAGDIIKAFMYRRDDYWYICANALSHVYSKENWWIDVMFVRTSMSTCEGY